jgi:predicted Zn-dependent peptidase
MKYFTTVLPNGVRIATHSMPHMKSVSVGLWVGVGGRHETKELCGISHFMEHLLFKGTERRSSREITEAIEGVGGFINAFTTEDHTCFYAKGASQHLGRLVDVLCDMYLNSVLAESEIDREREVIKEEILMYKDQPSQFSEELLTKAMWPRHALGRPLTGSPASLSRIKRKDLIQFTKKYYNGLNTIITIAGRCSHEEVVELVRSKLNGLRRGSPINFKRWGGTQREKRVLVSKGDTEQTHLALGYHAMNRADERRYALKLLSVILGENMSSRLFQQLRERYAYCYSIHTGTMTLEDSGLLSIHVGLDPEKLRKALLAIGKELNKIIARQPSGKELSRAKEYTIGQNDLSLESTTNQIMWMGESLLAYDKVVDPDEVQSRFNQVTPAQIREVAGLCFEPSRMGMAIVGPVETNRIEKWVEVAGLS